MIKVRGRSRSCFKTKQTAASRVCWSLHPTWPLTYNVTWLPPFLIISLSITNPATHFFFFYSMSGTLFLFLLSLCVLNHSSVTLFPLSSIPIQLLLLSLPPNCLSVGGLKLSLSLCFIHVPLLNHMGGIYLWKQWEGIWQMLFTPTEIYQLIWLPTFVLPPAKARWVAQKPLKLPVYSQQPHKQTDRSYLLHSSYEVWTDKDASLYFSISISCFFIPEQWRKILHVTTFIWQLWLVPSNY